MRWHSSPRYTMAMIRFLDRIITKDMDILEIGAGSSTIWLAKRAKNVLSYEHDARWHGRVESKAKEEGLENCEIIHDPFYPERGINPSFRIFDIVIIDGRGRIKSMETTCHLLKPGGYLILDDSQRTRYRKGKELLDGFKWKRTDFKTNAYWMSKTTTIWRKPE